MASDGRRVNRPYRKASEYLATSKQATYNGPRTISALEKENAELREKLTTAVRKMENVEVQFDQSREYYSTQMDVTVDKLNRTTQQLKLMQRSYSELQTINYKLEQRLAQVSQLENERGCLTSEIHNLNNKLSDAQGTVRNLQQENERLRKDCNLAVQLLQCNSGNFKPQKSNQLPGDLQRRVEQYQLDVSQYNEYINPCADSDGEEDRGEQGHQPYIDYDSVPTDLLAQVLRKPENVHLNLEDIDFINDPALNSKYKGKIKEKKLIKYEYETPQSPPSGENYSASRTMPRQLTASKNTNQQSRDLTRSSSNLENSSPWQQGPTMTSSGQNEAPGGGSPWELASDVHPSSVGYEPDDYETAASAYGAYPVSYRRPTKSRNISQNKPNIAQDSPMWTKQERSPYTKSKMTAAFNTASSPRQSTKGKGPNTDVYISQTYHQQEELEEDKDPGSSSSNKGQKSNESSKKNTPVRIPTDKEKGSNVEKSSLLEGGKASDDDDMVMTVELAGGSPKRKMYREKHVDEGIGLLHQSDQENRELADDNAEEERAVDCDDNKRESVDHDKDMIEYENERAVDREANVPEINLLNLDDNVSIDSSQSSPAHHIMMQETLLLNDLESPVGVLEPVMSTLLPDIPPPSVYSEPQYDGELILGGELPPPPPPDMFAEMIDAPVTHLQIDDQSKETRPLTPEITVTLEMDDSQERNTTVFETAATMDTVVVETSDQKSGGALNEASEELADIFREEKPDVGENYMMQTSNDGNVEIVTESASCDQSNENNNNESTSQENHTPEPLDVIELQEEPRSGKFNRRRRNSFDQAREFGNVMDD